MGKVMRHTLGASLNIRHNLSSSKGPKPLQLKLLTTYIPKTWIATDRSRARRCVEACVYGTLDFVGYPRFPAPVEFIAAVIAYYVHPVNIQTACLIMEGAEFTENIINGVERPVKAAELFAFTLRVRAGNTDVLTDA